MCEYIHIYIYIYIIQWGYYLITDPSELGRYPSDKPICMNVNSMEITTTKQQEVVAHHKEMQFLNVLSQTLQK